MEPPEGLQSIDKALCLDHIADTVLRQLVDSAAVETSCSFCGRKGIQPFAVPMDSVAREVYKVITWWYQEYDPNTYAFDDFHDAMVDLDTSDVVAEVSDLAFDDIVSHEVQECLKAAIVTPDTWASRALQTQFQYSWDRFQETVKHESRFVYTASMHRPNSDREAPARLSKFLEGLLGYAEKSSQMLVQLPEGTQLFRARMTDNLEELRHQVWAEPSRELGPAPAQKADAGRMNAHGVPLFYAAFTRQTAIAEVALHSPYDDVIAGGFNTCRRLTILDLTRKPTVPSPFEHEHRDRFLFVRFVDHFVENIMTPVILDGRERIEYLPTQIVTEYLRWAPRRRIDGIAFPSRADRDGKNVVLFFGPGEAFRTEPPTDRERNEDRLRYGRAEPRALTIGRSAISSHRVTRHVQVHNLDISGRLGP